MFLLFRCFFTCNILGWAEQRLEAHVKLNMSREMLGLHIISLMFSLGFTILSFQNIEASNEYITGLQFLCAGLVILRAAYFFEVSNKRNEHICLGLSFFVQFIFICKRLACHTWSWCERKYYSTPKKNILHFKTDVCEALQYSFHLGNSVSLIKYKPFRRLRNHWGLRGQGPLITFNLKGEALSIKTIYLTVVRLKASYQKINAAHIS